MKIKIGTRGSKLALWQAQKVKRLLKDQNIDSEIITIETKGDKILDVSLSKIGSKGVFTEEIEEQLKNGSIDIAVHSAKDLQSSLPEGFEIIAFDKREKTNDILLGDSTVDLNDPNLVLGTSSTRRLAFLSKYHPHVKTTPVRGNLQTRIRKMKEGDCNALWLAYAGAHRMGYDDLIIHQFDNSEVIPAVGQGSIAIEVYNTLSQDKKDLLRSTLNDKETETCILSERAFLNKMEGGCSVPVYALATLKENVLTITGGVISLDGQKQITKTCHSTSNAAVKAGSTLANSVLENGGKEILIEIKKTLSNS
ncbi:MAG: hydroxymethylbilane synthase [Reichenbachiella sp.]